MAVKFGVLALHEAMPNKGEDLAELLQSARSLAAAEAGIDDTTDGVFDTFESTDARRAHLEREIPAALASVGPDLLAKDPDIRPVDIVAVK